MSEQLSPLPQEQRSRAVLTLQLGEDGRLRLLPRPLPDPGPEEPAQPPATETESRGAALALAGTSGRTRASPAAWFTKRLQMLVHRRQPPASAVVAPASSTVVEPVKAPVITPVGAPVVEPVTASVVAAEIVVAPEIEPEAAPDIALVVAPGIEPAAAPQIALVVVPDIESVAALEIAPTSAPVKSPAAGSVAAPSQLIEFRAVSLRYGAETALADFSLSIEQGEFVAFVGPSGAGKTSALRLLQGLVRPTSGRLWVDKVGVHRAWAFRLRRLRRRTGVVFQDYRLLANRSAIENVAFALQVADLTVPRPEARRRAAEQLALVGLAGREKARPEELSGGQQQRLAIARALVTRPRILLADEPTASLDPKQARNVMHLFQQISRGGTTVVLATHDRALLRGTGARVVSLSKGKVVGDRRPQRKLWVVR